MGEAAISMLESALWVAFQTRFHTFKETGCKARSAMLLGIVCLTLNIWIADRWILYSSCTFLIDCIILLIYSKLCLKGRLCEHLYSILLFYISLYTCNFLWISVGTYFRDIPANVFLDPGSSYRMGFLVVTKLSLWGICEVIIKLRSYMIFEETGMPVVITIPVLTSMIGSLLMELLLENFRYGRSLWIEIALLLLISLLMTVSVVLLKRLIKAYGSKEKAMLLQMEVEAHRLSALRLNQYVEECRSVQHDFKHRLMVAEQYLELGDIETGKAYLREFLEELSGISVEQIGDCAWKSIIAIEKERAERQNIAFHEDIAVGVLDQVNEVDLCILLGNLLDNAIEFEQELEGDRKIRIQVRQKFGILYIKVGNRIYSSVLDENPDLYSTKMQESHHGFGIKRIREIVDKYGGHLTYRECDGWIWAEIWMKENDKKSVKNDKNRS